VTNGTWTSILKADIAKYDEKALPPVLDLTTNFTGTYTMQIPRGTGYPTDSPGGVGYGTITNSKSGIIALLGRTGDSGPKQTIGQKVNVGRHGDWPLYVGLYPSTVTFNNAFTGGLDVTNKSYYLGSMMGWMKFSSNNASVPPTNKPTGDVVWIKKATSPTMLLKTPTNAVYYTNGFSNELTLATAPYVMPTAGQLPINFTSGEVVVSDGNLSEPVTNTAVLIATNKVTLSLRTTNSAAVMSTNKMAIAFTKKSGEFKGSFFVGTNKLEFFGALLQDTTNASGHFLGLGTNSGHVIFNGQ